MQEWLQQLINNFKWSEVSGILQLILDSGFGIALVKIYSTYKSFKTKTPQELTSLFTDKTQDFINIKLNEFKPKIEELIITYLKPILEGLEVQSNNIKIMLESFILAKCDSPETLKSMLTKLQEVEVIDSNIINQIYTQIEIDTKELIEQKQIKEEVINELEEIADTEIKPL